MATTTNTDTDGSLNLTLWEALSRGLSVDVMWSVAQEFWRYGVWQFSVFYVVSQPLLQAVFPLSLYQQHRTQWKRVMAAYNFVMSVFSAVIFVYAFGAVLQVGVFVDDPYLLLNHPVFNYCTYLFYLSKYVEYMDTYFLIIAGKSVSFLQYFHHAGAAMDMFILWRYKNEGVFLFVVLNSFIHTFMYLYYALSALEYKWVHAFRVLVTGSQIVQLIGGNTTSIRYMFMPRFRADPLLVCGWTFNFVYVNSLVVLFAHFFYQNYVPAGKKSARPPVSSVTPTTSAATRTPSAAPVAKKSPRAPSTNGMNGHHSESTTHSETEAVVASPTNNVTRRKPPKAI